MQEVIYWINFLNYDCNCKHTSNSNKPIFKPKEAYDIDNYVLSFYWLLLFLVFIFFHLYGIHTYVSFVLSLAFQFRMINRK